MCKENLTASYIHKMHTSCSATWKIRKHLVLGNGRCADIADGRIYSVLTQRDARKELESMSRLPFLSDNGI
jgi:hypothetical protein